MAAAAPDPIEALSVPSEKCWHMNPKVESLGESRTVSFYESVALEEIWFVRLGNCFPMIFFISLTFSLSK